jgi:pimeloyl-ACP methyl ester carboxylesterase
MKPFIFLKNILLVCILFHCIPSISQNTIVTYQDTTSFYPNSVTLKNYKIEWGILQVPENWETGGSKIDLAIAKLKNSSGKDSAKTLVMIEGGPGASGIEGIWWWLNHPLRETHDIVFMDVRGTGFSSPRLCPDLGKTFLEILAKDQSPETDGKQKAKAANACKEQLISQNIDVSQYNSINITRDLHALKQHYNLDKWSVYGVSYGTYIAQQYAGNYPMDIEKLILDSPISDISEYYTKNTSNYVNSLKKVFTACENDPECNTKFPDLEQMYYNTIVKLNKDPITVTVTDGVVKSGVFTYNAEDFKIAIHQCLYQKSLIELVPLLIQQFHNRNENTLGSLVAAFSGALGLDYGVYYSINCQEAIPVNSINDYQKDVNNIKLIKEGLSFYQSDYTVCDLWNKTASHHQNDSIAYTIKAPTLIITGQYDPITPTENGRQLSQKISNAKFIEAKNYGHAAGFSKNGFTLVNAFVTNSSKKIDTIFENSETNFITEVYINGGVSKLGNALNETNLSYIIPLGLAVIIVIVLSIYLLIISLKNKQLEKKTKYFKILLSLASLMGIASLVGIVLAIGETASGNFYILAFGLPAAYSIWFFLFYAFAIVIILLSIYGLFLRKRFFNTELILLTIVSNLIIIFCLIDLKLIAF